MAIARFKDLCIDARDANELGEFWASALGLELTVQDSGNAFLSGPTNAHRIWVNRVPETKTVKHRIHLDVHGASVEELVALGATVVDSSSFAWSVMLDPEGGEFCLFLRDEVPTYRLYELVIDCHDHKAMSSWWGALLDAPQVIDERGFSYIATVPNAPFDNISFVPVEEPKTVKDRIHIDLTATGLQCVLDAGARLLRRREEGISWHVCADPEENEFCVFITDS